MERLIFDLGMHNGDDTRFYLARGFKVIALEASPIMCKAARNAFKQEIQDGRLVIVEKALWSSSDEELTFYVSKANSEWSSLDSWRAESGNAGTDEVKVATTTVHQLVEEFGMPHYIKCDTEGADHFFCKQLLGYSVKPDFVSVEGTSIDLMAYLLASGYNKFQLVNQSKIRRYAPDKKFSGIYGETAFKFTGHSSGPFGYDLEVQRWLNFSEAAFLWLKHSELKMTDRDLTLDSWFDFHATTERTLKMQNLT